jgi:hypothetical protein
MMFNGISKPNFGLEICWLENEEGDRKGRVRLEGG